MIHRKSFFTVLFAIFIAMLGIGVVIPVLPVFAAQLGATGFTLGLIVAAFSMSRGILQPVVGILSDRHGRKGFLMTGLFVYALVGLLIPLAPNVGSLIAIRFLHGAGSAMIVPIGMAYMSFLAPPGFEGRFMGYLNIALFFGIGCGPVFGGLFSDCCGMTIVFHGMAFLSGCALLLVLLCMPNHMPLEQSSGKGVFEIMGIMLRTRRTCGILLARYATMIMMVPTMAFLPVLMAGWQESSGLQVGLVVASRTLINAVLQIPFGTLTDHSNKAVLLFSGSTCMALTLLCIPHGTSFFHMIVLYLCLGLGEAIIWPVLGAYATEEGRTKYGHGTMMGVFHLAMSAGVFTGAMLAGTISDLLGMRWAFYLTAACVLFLSWLGIYCLVSGGRCAVRGS